MSEGLAVCDGLAGLLVRAGRQATPPGIFDSQNALGWRLLDMDSRGFELFCKAFHESKRLEVVISYSSSPDDRFSWSAMLYKPDTGIAHFNLTGHVAVSGTGMVCKTFG